MIPDPNKAHWVDMGVDIQFKILVTKAYAWDTAANSIVGIMEAPVRRAAAHARFFEGAVVSTVCSHAVCYLLRYLTGFREFFRCEAKRPRLQC
jgi:hypothetical protein